MVFPDYEPFPTILATLLAAMGIIAGFLITYHARNALTFAFGVWYISLTCLVFLIFLSILAMELGAPGMAYFSRTCCIPFRDSIRRFWARHFMNPLRRLLSSVFSRPGSVEFADLERGPRPTPNPRYPWNPTGSPTIGRPYPHPRLVMTGTGLPTDWDRPDNIQPISRELAAMRAGGPVRVTPSSVENGRTVARGTQTAMRNNRGPRADERMPGGMAPMRFWWLLLEEQRQQEMARTERENRRWSW